MGKYTEYSTLINNGNVKRKSFCEILFRTFVCVMLTALFVLLLSNLLLTNNGMKRKTSGTQMRLVNLTKVNPLLKSKFSDLAKEDLEAMLSPPLLGKCRPYSPRVNDDIFKIDGELPDSVDWRKRGVVSGVINQRLCNACWEASIVGVMESMVGIGQISQGTFHGVTPLSIQELIDCSYMKPGCSRGDAYSALLDMLTRKVRIVPARNYPLTLKIQPCAVQENPFPNGVEIESFRVFCQGQVSPELIKNLLLRHGPLVATVDANQWVRYNDGIISEGCSRDTPNHVVQIVGYDVEVSEDHVTPYYIIKNSWGTDFGDNGYVYIEMGKNLCGIEDYIAMLDVRT